MQNLLDRLDKFYIGGEWVAPLSDARFPVIDPATEERLGEVAMGNAADADRAVAAAVSAFESFAFTPKAERIALIERIRDISARRMDDLAQAIMRDVGAPITFAREVQADTAVGHADGLLHAMREQAERETLWNGDILLREPIGVCGLITPWNWPINQIVLKVLPAIAAGCTCVLKPSEYTPLSTILYAEILEEAGVPPGVFNFIQGDGPVAGAALSRHPDIAMMSFTGSTRGGTAVTKDAADTVKRVTLELGGKSPNLVFADCGEDLETRVRASVAECFLNTGQSCDAPTRMIVERSVYAEVCEIAADAARNTRLDDPAKEGDHIGPLFSEMHEGRVQALIEAGVAEGAKLLAGGPGRPEGRNRGYWARPTVFADVTPEMTIYRQEVFGPVLALSPFAGEAEAIAMANDTPYGLATYVQTGDMTRAERVAARLRAGAVHVNGTGMQYGTPFGGYKQSGNGREGGLEGLQDYQEIKTLHLPRG